MTVLPASYHNNVQPAVHQWLIMETIRRYLFVRVLLYFPTRHLKILYIVSIVYFKLI